MEVERKCILKDSTAFPFCSRGFTRDKKISAEDNTDFNNMILLFLILYQVYQLFNTNF